mmetsp:Transcript_22225/g.51270  ORF Transcript_22225/g.51270 Transcript_22225/m.51270 type:complete len:109 (-) Transcript_22225:323-649(-)
MHSIFKDGAVRNPNLPLTSEREAMLIEFSKAVTVRPLDHTVLQQLGKQLKEKYDEAVLVEAGAAAASMDLATKVVDATGRKPPPALFRGVLLFVLTLYQFFASPFVAS